MAEPRPRRRAGILSILTALSLVVLAGVGGYWFWQQNADKRTIAEQKRVIAELGRKLDRAWANELVADVRVNAIERDLNSGESVMDLTFVQYAPGTEIASVEKQFTLKGDEFFIDALVIRFDRKFVEAGDGLRGKSLLLFRRAFGDRQKPVDGVPLFQTKGTPEIPEVLQVDGKPSDFERQLWERFWELASDPDAAAKEGVRVAQGEAPHVRAVEGQVYKLTLRQSGGLEITPRLPAAVLKSRESTRPSP